jgi:hypothetical protein
MRTECHECGQRSNEVELLNSEAHQLRRAKSPADPTNPTQNQAITDQISAIVQAITRLQDENAQCAAQNHGTGA